MSHEKDLNIPALLDFYAPLLSEAECESADLYFNQDLSLSEIADITGISRNGVRLRLEKVKKLLLGYESALGLYKSYLVSSAEADKLENIIKENLTGKKQKEALGVLDKIKNGGNIADV